MDYQWSFRQWMFQLKDTLQFKNIVNSQTTVSDRGNQLYQSLLSHLPIGVQEQDWSGIKKYVDKLKSEGVEDLGEYFKNNSLILMDLIKSTTIVSINDSVLRIYGANSIDDWLKDNDDIEDWWNDEWVSLYSYEISTLYDNSDTIHHQEL